MDYETADGSQFSLRGVWKGNDGGPMFDYTTIGAYVDGIAYTARLDQLPDDVDEADVLNALEPVPPGCIHPCFPEGFTVAPELDPANHYIKAASFTNDDCQPGKTTVAECVLNEASALERLKAHPHPNIGCYHGCVVKDGLITHLCLKRYECNLVEYALLERSAAESFEIFRRIKAGVAHLHLMGLAHNDLNPHNVCIDSTGNPVLIDFDCCLPFGKKLIKGVGKNRTSSETPISSAENDVRGLDDIRSFMWMRWDHDPAREPLH